MRLIFWSLLLSSWVGAQSDAYFQQGVSYDIKVRLNDVEDELDGDLRLTYTNNSPDTLPYLVMHLWPRAFSGTNTAYARQALRNGSTRFHFADAEERGTLDGLEWQVDGTAATFEFSDEPDVGELVLPQPLLPGASITVSTPFRVKIPASFSRLGRVGDSYQLTQWYPKPAVYDRDGWHGMPYLDQGEFYSEFGDFRVEITLPENYVVAATGVLQEAEERNRLLEIAARTREELETDDDLAMRYVDELFPASASTEKTITYEAERVHDFAWFADKRFKVLHDTLHLRAAAQGAIDVWSFFADSEAAYWKNSIDYLKRSTRFYSEKVGLYPYPQVTGVQSALSAGGGMEYPMITVIGLSGSDYALDEVLAHEVGHNWFYGILGSNERDHAWMDEGLNSYYEGRYTREFYPDKSGRFQVLPGREVDIDRLGLEYAARLGEDQAPNTPSDSLARMNYWIAAYSKPDLLLQEVEDQVGTQRLDRAFQQYYDTWKFRHPQPEDFFASLKTAGIDVDTSLRPGILTTTEGQFNCCRDSRSGSLTPKVGLLTGQDEPGRPELFFAPLLTYNANDGVMAGLALHNRTLEPKILEYILAPMYGFSSGELGGFAGLKGRLLRPISGIRRAELDFGVQGFSDFEPTSEIFADQDKVYGYARTAVKASFIFDHAPITQRESQLYTQFLRTNRERPAFSDMGELLDDPRELTNHYLSIGYRADISRELTPLGYGLRLEYKDRDDAQFLDESHLRLEATVNGGYQYEAGKFFRWRLFGGYFLRNDLRERASYPASAFSLIDNAASDYRYDGLYLGRNRNGFYEQQIERRQGGFRAPISPSFNFGRSNDYLTALNVDADLPLPLPIGVFFDAGLYGFRPTSNANPTGEFNWVGGVSLSFLQGRIGVYAPFVTDPDTKELLQQRGNLLDRLSFRLSLSDLLPWRWLDEVL